MKERKKKNHNPRGGAIEKPTKIKCRDFMKGMATQDTQY